VIVVTDGANYQFIPEGMTSKRSTTIADVRQILSTTTVPVHLFGLGTRQSENGPAMQPLRELARETGGRSLSFSGPADLKRALASLLDPGTFHVRPAGDASAATRSASLGNTVRLRPSPGGSQPVSIRVEGDPAIESAFRIRAGESVQLSVDREHRVLVAPAYDHEVAARQALVRADGDATGMVVRVHRPTRFEDGRVSFPISWQQRAADQTPERWTKTNRPASIWVEVQPLDAEGQAVGDGFVFCDAAYRPHRPVPLVHLQATRWPVHSERARVRVYCRPSMTGTRDVDAVPLVGPSSSSSAPVPAAGGSPGLDRLLRLDQLSETAQRLDGGVTVSLHEDDQGQGQTAGGQRVRRLSLGLRLARASSESASPGSDPPRVGDFKLSLPSIPRSSLTRVVRRYDRGLGMAVHCFEWVDTGQSVPTVRVTDRATETASAWRMAAESVEVELRQADAFVRPVRELSAAGER
jgi:hypothetical protein